MKRLVAVVLIVCAILGCGGCNPGTDAYDYHIRQLQDQIRQLKQERDASAGLLNVSGFSLVITGCALAVCLFVLRRGGGGRRVEW